ncbi:MAG: flagellin, partial [Nitrosopumilaceae archaeon]
FVVLNMGFATTQKAKTTIISSLKEASSGIAVSGKITAIANVPAGNVNATSIPLKVTSGGDSINLDNSTVTIKYLSNTVEYDNILVATLSSNTYANLTLAFNAAVKDPGITGLCDNCNPVNGTGAPGKTFAIIYWTISSQNPPNAILEQGEHAVIGIGYRTQDKPTGLDKIRMELLLSSGATMTVERNIPNLTSMITDLG